MEPTIPSRYWSWMYNQFFLRPLYNDLDAFFPFRQTDRTRSLTSYINNFNINPNIYAEQSQTLTLSSNSSSNNMNAKLRRWCKENHPLRLPRRNMIHSRCSNLKKMPQQFLWRSWYIERRCYIPSEKLPKLRRKDFLKNISEKNKLNMWLINVYKKWNYWRLLEKLKEDGKT